MNEVLVKIKEELLTRFKKRNLNVTMDEQENDIALYKSYNTNDKKAWCLTAIVINDDCVRILMDYNVNNSFEASKEYSYSNTTIDAEAIVNVIDKFWTNFLTLVSDQAKLEDSTKSTDNIRIC